MKRPNTKGFSHESVKELDAYIYNLESQKKVTDEEIRVSAKKWSKERSCGSKMQDRDCEYDFSHGMREMRDRMTQQSRKEQ